MSTVDPARSILYISDLLLYINYILVALRIINIISHVRLKYIRKTIGVSEYFVISIFYNIISSIIIYCTKSAVMVVACRGLGQYHIEAV